MATPAPSIRGTASVAGLAEFFDFARSATTLPELIDEYARVIAREGCSWHILGISDERSFTPLLGKGIPHGPAYEIRVETWDSRSTILRLGNLRTIGRAKHARLAGIAHAYAAFAEAFLSLEQDVATNVGLGLAERQCLADLLMGRGDGEIAARMGVAPLAIEAIIASALRKLGAGDRATAVAIAARHGWLAGLPAAIDCSPHYTKLTA